MRKDYIDHDATGLAELVAKGETSAHELLDCAIEQAARLNPSLNAVVMLQESAARAMIDAGLPDGPFKGVPFLMKDLKCEAKDFPTNNGSKLFANHHTSQFWYKIEAINTQIMPHIACGKLLKKARVSTTNSWASTTKIVVGETAFLVL